MPAAKEDRRKRKGKRKRGKGASGVRVIETAKKAAEAMEYRLQGYTFEEIGQTMGMSTTRAYELVQKALEAVIAEKSPKVLAMELRRLDKMQAAFFSNAVQGDVKSAEMVMKVMGHRAKLMGLESPTKHELTGKDGKPIESRTTVNADEARTNLLKALAQAGVPGAAPVSPPVPPTGTS